MPCPLENTNLFKPLKVGNVTLKHRLAHAPTARIRNTDEFVATDSMLQYYSQRAENNGGLIIVEATTPALSFGTYTNSTSIETPTQVAAWKKIVDAIHEKGSFVSIQLIHLGRLGNTQLLEDHGLPLVAPSTDPDYPTAKELTIKEIKDIVKEFVAAAKRAINEAGFDFVEIHGAHMYLVDQFVQQVSNKRTDEYGGSIENRARLALELTDAVTEAVGAEHTAIRFSPYAELAGSLGINSEINPVVTWGYILSELEKRGKAGKRIAYVSIVEARVSGSETNPNYVPVDSHWINTIWSGVLVRSGALLHDTEYTELRDYVKNDDRTIIGSGRYYSSNPDLSNRLRKGYELTHYDRNTFYASTNWGYITWAKYGEPSATEESELAKKLPKALA